MSNISIKSLAPFTLLMAETVQASPGQRFKRRIYECFTAELVLEGCGWLAIDRKEYYVEAGDMYILPPGRDHEYYADSEHPWKKIFFNANGPIINMLLECYHLESYHFPEWGRPEIFSRMLNLYSQLNDEAHTEAALLFHKLIAIAYGTQPRGSYCRPVSLALSFIQNNLHNRIRLEDIAKASFISPSQLNRLFKKETGVTPYSFLYQKRIELSKHLLLNTDCMISDIANSLQFADQFYFSTAFKKAVGCSPSEYQKDRHRRV
ncbi:MAG: helix-turn-helix domain-containing protein [Planctomycetes bacterium]|nr:helix-turn-helix domain-containing protein [Planctomycetota bacterium]